jgi:hypothetical protein
VQDLHLPGAAAALQPQAICQRLIHASQASAACLCAFTGNCQIACVLTAPMPIVGTERRVVT